MLPENELRALTEHAAKIDAYEAMFRRERERLEQPHADRLEQLRTMILASTPKAEFGSAGLMSALPPEVGEWHREASEIEDTIRAEMQPFADAHPRPTFVPDDTPAKLVEYIDTQLKVSRLVAIARTHSRMTDPPKYDDCIIDVYQEVIRRATLFAPLAPSLPALLVPKDNPVSGLQHIRALFSAKPTAEAESVASKGEPEHADEPGPKSPSGFLGGAELADAFGIPATRRHAFFQRLTRERRDLGDDCWHQVAEPRPNTPRFIYRVNSPSLVALAKEYTESKLA